MGATPRLKIYTAKGEYVAACLFPEDAAAIVQNYGAGASIRWGHLRSRTVWTEGENADGLAGESFDAVAEKVVERLTGFGTSYLDYHIPSTPLPPTAIDIQQLER